MWNSIFLFFIKDFQRESASESFLSRLSIPDWDGFIEWTFYVGTTVSEKKQKAKIKNWMQCSNKRVGLITWFVQPFLVMLKSKNIRHRQSLVSTHRQCSVDICRQKWSKNSINRPKTFQKAPEIMLKTMTTQNNNVQRWKRAFYWRKRRNQRTHSNENVLFWFSATERSLKWQIFFIKPVKFLWKRLLEFSLKPYFLLNLWTLLRRKSILYLKQHKI